MYLKLCGSLYSFFYFLLLFLLFIHPSFCMLHWKCLLTSLKFLPAPAGQRICGTRKGEFAGSRGGNVGWCRSAFGFPSAFPCHLPLCSKTHLHLRCTPPRWMYSQWSEYKKGKKTLKKGVFCYVLFLSVELRFYYPVRGCLAALWGEGRGTSVLCTADLVWFMWTPKGKSCWNLPKPSSPSPALLWFWLPVTNRR